MPTSFYRDGLLLLLWVTIAGIVGILANSFAEAGGELTSISHTLAMFSYGLFILVPAISVPLVDDYLEHEYSILGLSGGMSVFYLYRHVTFAGNPALPAEMNTAIQEVILICFAATALIAVMSIPQVSDGLERRLSTIEVLN